MQTKRIFAVILSFVMCICILSQTVMGAEAVTFTAIDGYGESSPKEGYSKLLDGDVNTKWGTEFKDSVYVLIKASSPVILTGYSFTTGNDNASWHGRNPKDWEIFACNDYDEQSKSGSWESIAKIENDQTMEDVNQQTYHFTIDGAAKYQYYRLVITATRGASFMQLSEMGFTYSLCIHEWIMAETPATCTEPAYIISICKKCSEEEKEQTHAALGHVSDGSGICTRCGNTLPVRVGETYYVDPVTAVNEAAEESTIVLLADCSIENTIPIDKNLTLDLNGFTLTKTGDGGVIAVSGNKIFTLTDTSEAKTGTLTGGSTSERGGGVNVDSGCTFYMKGGTISDCSAKVQGGGVNVQGGGVFHMSDGAVIINCKAPTNIGGGISAYGTVTVTDSKIIGCSANFGGGIHVDGVKGGSLKLNNSLIESCSAAYEGGGIRADYGVKVTVENNTMIQKNSATVFGGGGIGLRDRSNHHTVVTVKDSSIAENTAPGGAGVWALDGAECVLDHAKVEKNKSTKTDDDGGGGIGVYNGSTATVQNGSEINENISAHDGGGIYARANATVYITDSSMWKNEAKKYSGGAIYATDDSTVMVEQSRLSENTAAGNGGGIYAIHSVVSLRQESYIASNNAQWGGGVYIHSSDLTANNANIQNNTASAYGGGVMVQTNSDRATNATITGGEISGNTANASNNGGGGIWMNGNANYKTTVNISRCSIVENTASYGGGIQVNEDDAILNLKTGTVIFRNHATKAGGGIYNGSANLNVEGDPQIYSNDLISTSGAPIQSNLHLISGKKISGSLEPVNAPPRVFVTLEDKVQNVTNVFEKDCSAFIRSDDASYYVVYDEATKAHKLTDAVRITLDPQHEGEYPIQESAPKGGVFAEPDYTPWWLGHRFLGWYKDGERYDFNETVTEDFTLTAKWAEDGKAAIELLPEESYLVSGLEGEGIVYLASYNAAGNLLDTKLITATNGEIPIRKTLLNTGNAAKIKAFLWSNTMTPLCESAVRTIK